MDFPTALSVLLEHEGGLVDDPRDPGGITKYGISLKAYPSLGKEGIKQLTIAAAGDIYKRDYWDAVRCDDMPDKVRLILFDCAVNQGVGFAAKALQSAAGVAADGKLGPGTLAKVNGVDPYKLVGEFAVLRAFRYMANPNFPRYGRGWLRRLLLITINTAR